MSVKGQYKAHKDALENAITVAITKFEFNTGCLVLSLRDETIQHSHFNQVDVVHRGYVIKTNIDGDPE